MPHAHTFARALSHSHGNFISGSVRKQFKFIIERALSLLISVGLRLFFSPALIVFYSTVSVFFLVKWRYLYSVCNFISIFFQVLVFRFAFFFSFSLYPYSWYLNSMFIHSVSQLANMQLFGPMHKTTIWEREIEKQEKILVEINFSV